MVVGASHWQWWNPGLGSEQVLQWVIGARGPKGLGRGKGDTRGLEEAEQDPSLIFTVPGSCQFCPCGVQTLQQHWE